MLQFDINKEKTDANFQVSEHIDGDCRLTIIKWKKSWMVSVFARRDLYDENHSRDWYIEIADHTPKNYNEAKRMGEKMLDVILWYKVCYHG